MADAGTAAPGPTDGGPADSETFQLEVSTVAGECLATIPDAQGSWQLGDVLGRLPQLLPGHRYQLLQGEAALAPGTALAEWAPPADGRACVTAVVVAPQTKKEQEELDVALIKAASAVDVDRVRELLSAGADAKYRDRFPTMWTALHAALEARLPRRPGGGKGGEEGNEEEEGNLQAVVGALLSARADVDALRESEGDAKTYALHYAVWAGSVGAVRLLLEAGANVEARANGNFDGRRCAHCYFTALHAATKAGNLPIAALLLERGADVNSVRWYQEEEVGEQDSWFVPVRETALHLAVAGRHQALVALLVQAGADVNVARRRESTDTSVEQLCAGKPGLLELLGADASADFLAGGGFGPEVEAALAAFAARRAAAAA